MKTVKKSLMFVAAIAALLCLLVFCASAYNGTEYGNTGIYYMINNGEAAITRCSTFATGSVHIPSEIEGYPVTRIYGGAFINCTKVRRIYIPKNVKDIEPDAFSWIEKLEGIYVDADNQNYCTEDGVLFTKNKTSLLRAPRTLTEYAVPATVTKIEKSAFEGSKI